MSHPRTTAIMEMVYRPCQEAIDRALHNLNVTEWHKRLGSYDCPICPSSHERRYAEIKEGAQRESDQFAELDHAKLVESMNSTAPSPALAKYLDDNELVPDEPEETSTKVV